VLVNPKIHVNTGWAFAQLTPHQPQKSVFEIIQQPIHTWKEELINDFEKPIFEAHPVLQNIKNTMYQQGALYASMSGSGSTMFGIFNKDLDKENIKKTFEGMSVYIV
jgi:4-diphosphocytidyl-2-C-methyl-D-erythritol kinase